MVKLLGCMCIFGSGIYLCRIQVLEVRRELDTLSTLTAALEQMAQEIRLTRTPLPRLMEILGRKRIGDTAAFFQTTASSLGKGLSAGDSWRRAAEDIPLALEDQVILAEVGNSLQGDEEQICKAIALATAQLEEHLAEKYRVKPEREKRATALCFSATALLVILLI